MRGTIDAMQNDTEAERLRDLERAAEFAEADCDRAWEAVSLQDDIAATVQAEADRLRQEAQRIGREAARLREEYREAMKTP